VFDFTFRCLRLPLNLVTHSYTSLSGVQSPPAVTHPTTDRSSHANLLRVVTAPTQLEPTGCKLEKPIVYIGHLAQCCQHRVWLSLSFLCNSLDLTCFILITCPKLQRLNTQSADNSCCLVYIANYHIEPRSTSLTYLPSYMNCPHDV
jgi:hypothetical protein